MRPRTRTKRTDTNQKVIINIFKLNGLSVLDLSALGNGCPDLLISCKNPDSERSITVLIEIKNPDSKSYQKQLKPEQEKFYNNWKGKIFIIKTTEEAEELSAKLKALLN